MAPPDQRIAALPPGAAVFAAMLGYDPISHLIPASLLASLPPGVAARVTHAHFFASLLAQPFVTGIRVALVACVAMSVLAGVASAFRGPDRRRMDIDTRATDIAVAVEPI